MTGKSPIALLPTSEPVGFSPFPSCSQTCHASAWLLCLPLASIRAFEQPASPLGWVFSFVFTVGINQDLQRKGNLQPLLVYCLIWEMLLGWAHVSGLCCFVRDAFWECCGKRGNPCLPWAGSLLGMASFGPGVAPSLTGSCMGVGERALLSGPPL